MRDFLKIAGRTLAVAGGLALLVFVLAFAGPLIIGGPGAHQAPLAAFLYAPGVFFPAFVIALVAQIRTALRLNIGGKVAYLVLLALFLVPTFNIVGIVADIDPASWIRNADFKAYSKSERLKHIPPLTEEERRLLQITHFNVRIGVVNAKFPAVYTHRLVDDLKKTGLLDEVAVSGQIGQADLIATLKGTYSGDKQGQSFTLRPPDGPGKEVSIKIYYTLGGLLASGERKQYLERLSLALIDAVPELLDRESHDGSRRDGGYTGRGTFAWANGDRYEGAFVDGKRTGRGTFIRSNGTRYEGDFVDGVRTGQGAMTWPNGNRYEGDFVDDKRTGRGSFVWKNGTHYEGDFVDNMIAGHGIMIWPSGIRYEGDFVRGRRTGQGTMILADGSRYEGAWRDGKPHGFGTKTDATGRTFSGTWTNGCFWQGDAHTGFATSAEKCELE